MIQTMGTVMAYCVDISSQPIWDLTGANTHFLQGIFIFFIIFIFFSYFCNKCYFNPISSGKEFEESEYCNKGPFVYLFYVSYQVLHNLFFQNRANWLQNADTAATIVSHFNAQYKVFYSFIFLSFHLFYSIINPFFLFFH